MMQLIIVILEITPEENSDDSTFFGEDCQGKKVYYHWTLSYHIKSLVEII